MAKIGKPEKMVKPLKKATVPPMKSRKPLSKSAGPDMKMKRGMATKRMNRGM